MSFGLKDDQRRVQDLVRRVARERVASSAHMGPQTYGWAQVQNIRRDPFEQAVGEEQKSVLSMGGTLASPSTAYIYNWNMLAVGQQLWLKELETYVKFPPLQSPESYNLTQVMQQIDKMNKNPSR